MPFVSPYTLGLSHQILILLHLHCRHLLEQGEGEEMYSLLLLFYDGLSQALSWMPEAKRKGGGNLFSLASLDPIAGGNFSATVPGPNSTGGVGPEGVVEMEMELELWGMVGRSLDSKAVSWFQQDREPTLTSWAGMPWDKKSCRLTWSPERSGPRPSRDSCWPLRAGL